MTVEELLDEKMASGREYRRFLAETLEIRAEDDGGMVVDGYAATFNEPYELFRVDKYVVREEIIPSAFDGCDMSDVIMQYDHAGHVFARTSNNTLNVTPDFHGLKIRANLGGTEIGRQLFEEIKGGYTTRMSFGFIVDKDERIITEDHETGTVDVLRRIVSFKKLYDVSAVSVPANDATEISARSFVDGVIAEFTEEVRKKAAREQLKLKLRIMEVLK